MAAPPQGPSDYAPALREYTGEESDEPVAAFLMTLGGRPGLGPGLGLCRAAATRAVAGNAFGECHTDSRTLAATSGLIREHRRAPLCCQPSEQRVVLG